MSILTDISVRACVGHVDDRDPSSAFDPPPALLELTLGQPAHAALFTCRIDGARRLTNDAFIEAIADAYRSIWTRVTRSDHRHPVRLWNGVPGIHDRVDNHNGNDDDAAVAGRDRYMLFNAGRFVAMRDWFAGGDELVTFAPAASGVGIDSDDFVLHAIALATPGTPIQNPRQTPAAHYSRRYGPLPPCFARATRIELDGRSTLLVSGTAAILGEDSKHDGDCSRQLRLTIDNLAAVVEAAGGARTGANPLPAYTSLRVYLPPATARDAIEPSLRDAVGAGCAIEFVNAQLCRRELLVEIEGVADLTPGSSL